MAVASIGVFLVAFTLFAQFAVWQYGRGAVRSAALEAARAASTVEPVPGACERRFADVQGDLLGGAMGTQVGAPRCTIGPDTVTVIVDASFERWLPFSPDWDFTVTAVAVREVPPA